MWFGGRHLDDAYAALTAVRPCGPKRDAVRGATYDLARTPATPPFESLPAHAFADLSHDERARVAGEALHRGRVLLLR